MRLLISLTILLVFLSYLLHAQVTSKAYGLMLKGLLSHSVPEINADEAAQKQASALFLDARAMPEYQVSHIKNARFVGYDDFALASISDIAKDQKIIVYCSVGYRSEKIAEQLIAAGFQDVSNLYGGIFEWKNRDYPVYVAQSETENVHAYDRVWGLWLKKGNKVY